MSSVYERSIINNYGTLTPSRILAYFADKSTFFRVEHKKAPYTFIILGNVGSSGKTWLCNRLKECGFAAFELTESICGLVDYRDNKNHVIENEHDRSIIIVLNNPL